MDLWGQAREPLLPVVRAAREEHLKMSLGVEDVSKSPTLIEHFHGYCLRDFFDQKGQRRYQNLSMSVAAKQDAHVGPAFGSVYVVQQPKSQHAKHLSARAYRLATEMVQRDRETIRQRNEEQFRCLRDADKVQLREVQKRQQEMLFLEVPDAERLLPRGCTLQGLLPPAVSRREEKEERRRFDKVNKDLVEGGFQSALAIQNQKWLLRHDQVMEVISAATAWVAATGLPTNLGVDRSTYCQFLLDLELVDQERVPYVWAVAVFDRYARALRACDPDWCDPNLEGRIPVVSVITKWDFACVLDAVLRQRHTHGGEAAEFMHRLKAVAPRLRAEWKRQEMEERGDAYTPAATLTEKPAVTLRIGERTDRKFSTQTQPAQPQQISAPRQIMTFGNLSTPGAPLDSTARWADPASGGAPSPAGASRPTPSGGGGAGLTEAAAWQRNRRISGMLVEPEVLQLVEQYRELFQSCFDSYAGGGSGQPGAVMHFVDLLQFCEDFHIVPRIASRHEVLRAYQATECTQPERPHVHPSASGTTLPSRTSATAGGTAYEAPPALEPLAPGGALLAPLAAAPHHLSSDSDTDASDATGPSASDGRGPQGGGGDAAAGAGRRGWYGLAAFVETLCRVGFTYLLVYGNNVQLATSSRGKMVWLIVYLHHALARLHQSLARRSEAAAEAAAEVEDDGGVPLEQPTSPAASKRLERVLQLLGPDAFLRPEPPPLQRPLDPESPLLPPPEPLPSASPAAAPTPQAGGDEASKKVRRPSLLNHQNTVPASDSAKQSKRTRTTSSFMLEPSSKEVAAAAPPRDERASSALRKKSYFTSVPLGVLERAAQSSPPSSSPRIGPGAVESPPSPEKLEKKLKKIGNHPPPVPDGEPPPTLRDAMRFSELLFSRLLRSSMSNIPEENATAAGGRMASKKAATGVPGQGHRRSHTVAAATAVAASQAAAEKARKQRRIPGRFLAGLDEASGTGRRFVVCLEAEREALAKDLDLMACSLDRSNLTPPPMSAYAVQLGQRVDRMMNGTPG